MSSERPTSSPRVSVHACGPNERAEQTRLYNACFKKPLAVEGLVWRYDHNPCGRAVSLLSRPAGESGVSGYACQPRRALSFGNEATLAIVGETGDVMTHPDWRKRGLFSELDREAMRLTREQGWAFVFGLPNRRSAHIFVELGWESVGRVRPWTLVLRGGAPTRAARQHDGRLKAWLSPWHALAGRQARERWRKLAHGLRAQPLQRFPSDVVQLSRAVEPRFAFMVRREAEYLDWRFAQAPSGLFRIQGIWDDAEALVGYAVVQLPRAGESVGWLVDVLALEERSLAAALEAGVACLEAAGAGLVRATAIDTTWWSKVLAANGFQAPKSTNHLTVILHPHNAEHPLTRAARDLSGWYFTDGDRDDETMG